MSTTTERFTPQPLFDGSTPRAAGPRPGGQKLLARAALHARAVEIMAEQGKLDPDYLAALARACRENAYLANVGEVNVERGL